MTDWPCITSNGIPSPVKALEDRLSVGGDPDPEFYARLENCARLFQENPEARILHMPRLRRAQENPLTANLWEEAREVLDSPQ